MYLVAIAWMYVVLMMAAAEATGPNGTVLGAVVTLLLYGLLPVGLLLYLMGTPLRLRARRAREQASSAPHSGLEPDEARHPASEAIAPKREEA